MNYQSMSTSVLAFFVALFLSGAPAFAERLITDIEPSLIIQPLETKTVTIELDPSGHNEAFWQITGGTLNGQDCQSAPCIRVVDKNIDFSTETFNYNRAFDVDEKSIVLELTNIADTPVTLQVQRIIKTCGAQACNYMESTIAEGWKVLRAASITKIETSEDGSYSRISGKTIKGKNFDEIFVWWKFDAEEALNCAMYIPQWIKDPDTYTPPFILAGGILPAKNYSADQIIMNVDTCTPRGENFNAAPEDDFDHIEP